MASRDVMDGSVEGDGMMERRPVVELVVSLVISITIVVVLAVAADGPTNVILLVTGLGLLTSMAIFRYRQRLRGERADERAQ